MAILDLPDGIWREALSIYPGQEPAALILEGTWWREQATETRLAKLSDVRELPFPDMFIGRFQGANVAYCCAYGAPRAVEPAHIFAQIGTQLIIQIGTCGALDAAMSPGDVVLPQTCLARDGVSQYYGADEEIPTDEGWTGRAESTLKERGIRTWRTRHLTWPSLFAQSDQMCNDWTHEGLQSVDMETSAVAAVAARYGASAIAMLTAWDVLTRGRTFLDPLDEADDTALKRANETVYDVALSLAKEVALAKAA